jgi:drug/metabolite transporter (DMT)-like permease
LNANLPPPSSGTRRAVTFIATGCGLLAAVGYTASNACLRSVVHCDPVWVSTIKAFPVVVLAGPWLLVLYARGERILPAAKVLGALALSSLVGQLVGNVLFQWALGVVGLALAVPITLGTTILAGAVLGRFCLHEPLTLRTLAAVVVLIAAISVLSAGVGDAHRAVVGAAEPGGATGNWRLLTAGVAAATLSGIAYSFLGVVIRYGVCGRTSVAFTMFAVGITGTVGLGGLAEWRIGVAGMLDTPAYEMGMMLLAGGFNALAFLALTKSLQLADLVYVNALNATQAALAVVAGVVLFREAWSQPLTAGIVLTVAGLLIMKRGR